MKNKKKVLIRIINILLIFIILLCLFNVATSLYNIYIWKKEGDSINKLTDKLMEITEINQEDSNNVVIVDQGEELENSKYINMDLINVSFDDLKEINEKVAGWIQVSSTNVNYPFVQTDNNSYYLKHSFDNSYNSAGWVFLDYRNKSNLSDKNNIIYAHGRYDKTMFGSLRDSLTNGWLDNDENFVIKISTPYQNSLWQIFSIYHIPTTDDYLQIDFKDDDDFIKFTQKLIDRSAYNFQTNVDENDKILTLSTCYNSVKKVVFHAKLIKFENKTNQ